jgi:hypothetical protein
MENNKKITDLEYTSKNAEPLIVFFLLILPLYRRSETPPNNKRRKMGIICYIHEK